jgi:transcription elongation factor GreB
MARALIKKAVDDEAVVETPNGQKIWYVNKITYQAQSE